MTQIIAYLTFNGTCREAMTFYRDCLGGELTIQTVGESPIAGQMPPNMQDKIMHSSLVKDGLRLMASEMAREKPLQGNTMGLCIVCSTEEEINSFFSKLSVGGQITDPLQQQFWGDTFGSLTDKYGVKWMFNYSKN